MGVEALGCMRVLMEEITMSGAEGEAESRARGWVLGQKMGERKDIDSNRGREWGARVVGRIKARWLM